MGRRAEGCFGFKFRRNLGAAVPLPSRDNPKDALLDTESLLAECAELEDALQLLRARYEMYFLGVERAPPAVLHDKTKRRVHRLKNSPVRSTAVRFRSESINAQLLTFERLWKRTLMEIENGVYRRDLFKAKLHQKEREQKRRQAAPAKPALPPVVAPPPVAAPSGLSEAKVRAVYEAYVIAKRQCNEDTTKLTFDSVAANLRSARSAGAGSLMTS